MFILILVITAITALPFKDASDEMEHTRCWTVSTPEDAAILVYQHGQKANDAGVTMKVRLVGLDLSTMKAREEKVPDMIFKIGDKASCQPIPANPCILIAITDYNLKETKQ